LVSWLAGPPEVAAVSGGGGAVLLAEEAPRCKALGQLEALLHLMAQGLVAAWVGLWGRPS